MTTYTKCLIWRCASILIATVVGVGSMIGVAAAQSPAVDPNQPYTVQFQHDGQKDPAFRLWIDGAIAKNYTAAEVTKSAQPDSAGLYTYSVAGVPLAKGTHTLLVSAVNSAGEAKSDPLTVSADWTSAPSQPKGVTIIKITVQVTQGGGQ